MKKIFKYETFKKSQKGNAESSQTRTSKNRKLINVNKAKKSTTKELSTGKNDIEKLKNDYLELKRKIRSYSKILKLLIKTIRHTHQNQERKTR